MTIIIKRGFLMNILNFDDIMLHINNIYNVDYRKLDGQDFWHWIVEIFGFIENPDFSQDECHKHTFELNFDKAIEKQTLKYQEALTFYNAVNHNISMDLYSYYKTIKDNGDFHLYIKVKNKEELELITDKKSKIISSVIFRLMETNKKDIQNDLEELNPQWIIDFVYFINKDFSKSKDSNGTYHFKFNYE
jgi:hypothetical protein